VSAFPVLTRHGASALFFIATDFLAEPETHIWFDRLDAALAGWPAASLDDWIGARLLPVTSRKASTLRRWLKYSPAEIRNDVVSELERLAPTAPATLYEDARPLLWTEVREMAAAGMTFGGHTASHQILAGTSVEKARNEVVRCRRTIENELQVSCWSFSYPNGEREDFREEDKRSVREAGFLCAFTQIVGLVHREGLDDRFALPRVPVPSSGSLRVFKSRASGLHPVLRTLTLGPDGHQP
jgi:peptidoglycan/xylan/chitin deacetylase (PgdA/CDA1 family)